MNMLGPGQSLDYNDWYKQWFSGKVPGQEQAPAPEPQQVAFESPFQAAMPEVPSPGAAKPPQAWAPQPQNIMAQGGAQSAFEGLDPLRQEMAMAARKRLGMG